MADKKGLDFKSLFGQLESNLDVYLGEKAPQLPKEWKEFLVKAMPYLSILGVIGGIKVIFDYLRYSSYFGQVGMMLGRTFGFDYVIYIIFYVGIIILEGLAISPLFNKKILGWRYLYYSSLLWVVQILISLNLIGVIFVLIPLYLLFQVREYYK